MGMEKKKKVGCLLGRMAAVGWDGLFEINGMEKKEKVGGRKE